jgi:carnosine N-methyltransferase
LKWSGDSRMLLSADEVLHLADIVGFDVDGDSRKSIETVYEQQPGQLMKFVYGM